MKLRKVLNDLVRVITDEAGRNPDFENRIAEVLGLTERSQQRPYRDAAAPSLAAGQRPKSRRPPPMLDPVELAQLGEAALREGLAKLSLEQLKDIVAEFGMDSGKLVIKWKTPDRIIERIVEISIARAQKGDAFRAEASLPRRGDMDLDYTHLRLMAAIKGIVEGKRLSDEVPVPSSFGRSTKVLEALKDGVHLDEPFHSDHLEIVEVAFKKLGLTRKSDRKSEVASALLKSMTK